MEWNQEQIEHQFQDDDAFETNYCNQLTIDLIGGHFLQLKFARMIAKRLAELMPHSPHDTPKYRVPKPWLTVSRFTGPRGRMDEKRVAVFRTQDNQFFLGLRCQPDAETVNGLRFEGLLDAVPELQNYGPRWTRLGLENDHLCIKISIPHDWWVEGDHPLANGQPLARALQWIDANRPETPDIWCQNFLTELGLPADGVITPKVMALARQNG